VHPLAKAIGFIGAIVAVGLARSPWLLFGLIGISLGAAGASNVDLKSLVRRVAEAVAFFGIVVAAPVSLRAVTSGPVAFSVLGLEASSTGLQSAGMILLRLAAGISLAIVWNLTTKWYELLRSLRSLGVPALFLTTATLTYRYLFVVIETMSEMVQARSARDVGGMDKRQGRTYAGSGAAILFAKSQAFTEEVHHAMQARSLGAVSKAPYARAWRLADSVSVIVGLGSLVVAVAEGVSRVV